MRACFNSMASALQKLLRRSASTRIQTAFHNSQVLNPLEPLAFHNYPILKIDSENRQPSNPISVTEDLKSDPSRFTMIYPSFRFGFSLNPISSSGFCPPEAKDAALDDPRAMWADSVKKKRKQKMNKQKYKKLRKRRRGQS